MSRNRGKVIGKLVDFCFGQPLGVAMHDRGWKTAGAKRQHLGGEIFRLQPGENRSAADAVAVGAVTGGARGRQHAKMRIGQCGLHEAGQPQQGCHQDAPSHLTSQSERLH